MAPPSDDEKKGQDAAPAAEGQAATELKTDKAASTSATESGLRAIEMRYMELLEKRIADLEAKLKEAEKDKKKDDKGDKDDADKPLQRSHTDLLTKTNIRYRQVKYTEDGLEDARDITEKEFAKVEQSGKAKHGDDIVWTRHFNNDNKYDYTEAQVVGAELQDLLKAKLAHDPRLHFPDNSNNEFTMLSPFEPLLHIWDQLEELVETDINDKEWSELRKQFEEKNIASAEQQTTSPLENVDDKLRKAKKDLTTLVEHIRKTQEISSYFSGLEASKTSRTVQFEYLWTLFPPGELVYSTVFMDQPQIFIVKESQSYIRYEKENNRENTRRRIWNLVCWSYDWDGKKLKRVPVEFKFDHFQGARKVNTLPCFPLKYRDDAHDPESEVLKKQLIKRGKKFIELCVSKAGKQMFDYEGDTISHGSGFQRLKHQPNQSNHDVESIMTWLNHVWGVPQSGLGKSTAKMDIVAKEGRVMVDFESYLQHAPDVKTHGPMGKISFAESENECHCGSCLSNERLIKNQRRGYDEWDINKELTDEQYLICPPRVLGYHLDSRTWLELNVDTLSVIPQPISDSAFKKLQLQKQLKEMIRDLVQSHISGTGKKPLMEDIIKNKGQGLVILLHGPPGVGKTLTAESVAAMAGKPLFSISSSDIGLDPADVEHNLESLFRLAARWHAVLLFDEADVFLESRSSHTSDLTRNALVSVLLRVLEYYSGILILTTNRINQFDIAVQSRVNLGIKYTNLNLKQKQQIFRQFIDLIPDENIDNRDEIYEWFTEENEGHEYLELLNGRQVRNVLFSAGNLAQRKGGVLTVKHLNDMAKHTWKFTNDLKAVVDLARAQAEAGQTPS